MEFFISTAWAQAAPSPTGGMLGTILPLLLIFVVFYFLLIRPQTKRAKEHREMIGKLAAGDEVVTNGGLLGRITEVSDSFVTLQVASGVAIQVQKFQVATVDAQGHVQGRLSAPVRFACNAIPSGRESCWRPSWSRRSCSRCRTGTANRRPCSCRDATARHSTRRR